MRTVKCFIASSEELHPERLEILRRLAANDPWIYESSIRRLSSLITIFADMKTKR